MILEYNGYTLGTKGFKINNDTYFLDKDDLIVLHRKHMYLGKERKQSIRINADVNSIQPIEKLIREKLNNVKL